MHHKTTTIMASMDHDTDANAIIEYARHLAVKMDARLVLFRSIYDPSMQQRDAYGLSEHEQELEAKAIKNCRNELLKVANALQVAGIEVNVSVNWRSPHHTAFRQLANRLKPVLIVCGRSTPSPVNPSEDADRELFELTDIPVLYVDRSPGQLPANVVWAAVDFVPKCPENNSLDDLIIERAKHLAVATDSELHLVHFYSASLNTVAGSRNRPEQTSVSGTQLKTDEKHMAALLKLATQHNIDHDKAHTFPGVAEAILPILADKKQPDIIVAGANNKGLVSQFPSGTTARKLLNRITGALCIVRLPHATSMRDPTADTSTLARA